MSCAAKSLAGKTADMEKWIRVRRVKLFLARFSWKVPWLPCGHIRYTPPKYCPICEHERKLGIM